MLIITPTQWSWYEFNPYCDGTTGRASWCTLLCKKKIDGFGFGGAFSEPSEIRILTICFGGIQVIYLYEKIEPAMSPFITGYLTFSYVAFKDIQNVEEEKISNKTTLNKVDARQDVHYSVTEATTKMIESPTESS